VLPGVGWRSGAPPARRRAGRDARGALEARALARPAIVAGRAAPPERLLLRDGRNR